MNLSKFIVACAGTALLLLSNYSFSAQCSAVFPDVIATHGNGVGNSQINFGFNARLINNPDTELSTRRVNHNSGSNINSCGSANCTASNASAETASVNFVRGGGTIDVNPGFNQTITFGTTSVNNYDQVNASSQATLNFSTGHNVYYFERLALGSDNVLNLLAGKTYYFRQFSVGSNTRVNVVGSGTAIVYVDSAVSFLSTSKINSSGINQSGNVSSLVMHVNGNVTLNSQSTFSGALYANNINFNSPSYLFGVASGRRVTLNSNANLTYDNSVFNADFGEVCESSANQATPIANFKFDETEYGDVAGEVVDSIGSFHSRAKFAQPVDGKVCRALDLSTTGTSDYVILNEGVLDNKREFSVSLWAKTAKTSNQSFLSGATSGSFNELIMWFPQHRQFTPHLQNGSSGSLTTSSIAGDTWRHIVWTHGNNQSCLFIDKVSQGCVNQTTSTLDIQSLVLGQEQDNVGGGFASSQAFDGLIDELVIFDEAIGQSQIEQIYDYQNQGLGLNGETIACPAIPPPTFVEPIANFKFDEIEYADIDGEVIDSVGSFHSRAKSSQPIDGKVCRAIDLSATGTSDYVVLDKDVLSGKREFSVSVWTKTAKTSNQSILSGAVNRSNNELIMWFPRDTRFTPYLQNRQNGTLTVDSIAGDTWHHVVWTHGKNKSCLFVDKVAQGCVNQTTSILDIASLILGQEQDSVGGRFDSSQAYNGLLDELIIYDDVIGQAQIDQIYDYQNNGLGLDGQPLACDNEIIAQYSMDETTWSNATGDVIDATGNFNASAVAGANTDNTTPALTGNPGTCGFGTFDGNDDYVELPSSFENLQDSFTITAWIKPDNVNSGSRIFIDDENNQRGFGFSLGDPGNGRLRFFSRGVSPISVDTNASIVAGDWSFVTAVHNSITKTRQIYINGVAQTITGGGTSHTYTGTWGIDTGPASIGGETAASRESGSRFHFTGAIDEVHVFRGALSASEIDDMYKKRHPCAEPVIHHYEIVHDGNGLTCAAEPITIKACTNSDCSTLSTESVSLDFITTGSISGQLTKSSPTFTGSTSFNFNHTTAETLTLSINNASVNASFPVECTGVGGSCDMRFESAGFRFLYGPNELEIIPTQTSAIAMNNLKLQAVKDVSGVCEGIFAGNVAVNLSQQNIQPNDNSGLPFQVNNGNIAKYPTFSSNVLLNFSNDSKAELPLAKYLDAGKIQLHASYRDGDISLAGNSNQFWVKPTKFEIAATNSGGNLEGDSVDSTTIHKAGDTFTFTVRALNDDDNETPNYLQSDGRLQLSVERVAPVESTSVEGVFLYADSQSRTTGTLEDFQDVTLTSFSTGTRGVSTFDTAQYNEVGIFSVDISDVDYGEDGDNGLDPANVEAEKVTVGRFIPSHFIQTIAENDEVEPPTSDHGAITGMLYDSQCQTESWVYSGQITNSKGAIRYVTPPTLTISAFNVHGDPTKNYYGDFAKIKGLTTNVSGNDVSFDSALSTHDNGLPLISDLSAIGNFEDVLEGGLGTGVLKYTLSDEHHFTYIRNSASEIDPFYATFELPIDKIQDSDGVASTSYENPNFVSSEGVGVEVRFGRWLLENSYGPETSEQVVPSYSQFLKDDTFVTNTDDNCSVIISSDESDRLTGLLVGDGTLSSNYTELDEAVDGLLENGLSRDFILTAPGQGNVGDIKLEYTAPPWLLYDWSGDGTHDDNPTSTATFGLYRGNDRIISWREVTN